MRLHNAAALALVGWYLIAPPFTSDGVNSNAPMPQWQQMASFNGAPECKRYAASLRKDAADRAGQNKDPRYRDMLRYAAQSIADTRCIASDDPRLRGK